MEMESCVPPGFRFHPTEEELVGYYLTRKLACEKIDLGIITDIDLYRIEPWDLQGVFFCRQRQKRMSVCLSHNLSLQRRLVYYFVVQVQIDAVLVMKSKRNGTSSVTKTRSTRPEHGLIELRQLDSGKQLVETKLCIPSEELQG